MTTKIKNNVLPISVKDKKKILTPLPKNSINYKTIQSAKRKEVVKESEPKKEDLFTSRESKEKFELDCDNDKKEDAIFLSRLAKKVYLIVRRNELRATKVLQEEVKGANNVEILYETVVKGIVGENKFEGLLIKAKNDIIMSELTVDGVFVGIGMNPSSMLLKDKVEMDGDYIKADETCETSVKGIYAVGDVRKKQLRQVITACADGANAITSIQNYLSMKNKK